MLYKILPKIIRTVTINVSRKSITFEETVLFRKKITEIPAEELEELELGELLTKHIIARSDKTSVKFGQGLSHEELTYIHSLIKKVIAGK